ncbi:MAG: trigger factor [Opitutales bacterium]
MNTNIETINDTRKKITVTLDAAECASEKELVIADFVKHSSISGFRKGKAPLAMVLKRYEKDIKQACEKGLVQKAVQALNDIKEFDIFAIVSLDQNITEEGATIDMNADIYPEMEIPADLSTTVELDATEVKDEEIERVMDYYRNQYAKYETVEAAVAKGNYVNVSYEGKIGDTLISEIAPNSPMYGTQKSTWEEAGNENAPGVQAIVQGLVDMNKGDKKTVTETFAEDFSVAELAGKEATYEIEVLEVKEKILPTFDEEFCKTLKVESEEALRTKVKEDIEKEKVQYNEVAKREKAVEQLMAKVEFNAPETAIEEEKEAILSETMMRYMSQGVSREVLEQNKEALFEGAEKDAQIRSKMRIFLNRLAKANKLVVDNDDLSRIIWQEAMRERVSPDEFVKKLKGDQKRINRFKADALLQKAINFVAEKAEVKTKEA